MKEIGKVNLYLGIFFTLGIVDDVTKEIDSLGKLLGHVFFSHHYKHGGLCLAGPPQAYIHLHS